MKSLSGMLRATFFAFVAMAAVFIVCPEARAITGEENGGISRPPGRICWRIKVEPNGHYFYVVPCDVVDPEFHSKCRELIGGDNDEPGHGFMFFIVIVDNHRGDEPVTFNAFGGDGRFYYYPPDPNASAHSAPPEPRRYGFVDLRNYFNDRGNVPKDKAAYAKLEKMFKTNLKAPAGEYGWSLVCIRDSFTYDLHRNKVTWAIPGDFPQTMDLKRFSGSLLRRAGVRILDD